jgi:hypothetical protein
MHSLVGNVVLAGVALLYQPSIRDQEPSGSLAAALDAVLHSAVNQDRLLRAPLSRGWCWMLA